MNIKITNTSDRVLSIGGVIASLLQLGIKESHVVSPVDFLPGHERVLSIYEEFIKVEETKDKPTPLPEPEVEDVEDEPVIIPPQPTGTPAYLNKDKNEEVSADETKDESKSEEKQEQQEQPEEQKEPEVPQTDNVEQQAADSEVNEVVETKEDTPEVNEG